MDTAGGPADLCPRNRVCANDCRAMMKTFAHWISKKLITECDNIDSLKVRSKYGALEGWTSIVINTLLFVVKITVGLAVNSISLIADAVHTLADTATSIVVIIGFRMAKKPSDREHPFGHARMESIATLIVSLLLFQASFELLKGSVRSITHPSATSASIGVILLIVLTVVIKELMARFAYALGDIIDSEALRADALHHRSDVVATALVVVALVASRFGYVRVDGAMGIAVSLIIAYSAYRIAKEAITPLLGEAPSREKLKEIEDLAKKHDGVFGVHDIICHRYGNTNIISLHIEVSDKESAFDLHDLSELVEDTISRKMPGITIVHVDPLNKDHPRYGVIEQAIRDITQEDERVHSFHDLRIVGCKSDRCNVLFDIVLEQDADQQESYDIVQSIRKQFGARFPEMRSVVKAEPRYAYSP